MQQQHLSANPLVGAARTLETGDIADLGAGRVALHRTSTDHSTVAIERRPPGPADPSNWIDYADFVTATRRHLDAVPPGGCVGVVAVDIDHFEALTAIHGGRVGLEVLTKVASRISVAVRPHDLIARVDGNGFALTWLQPSADTAPADIGSRIARQFDRPVMTTAGELSVTVTIGVASVVHHEALATEVETLLAQARAAAVAARSRGRSRITEFNPIMLEQAVQAYTTEHQLRAALRNDVLTVGYQPIVNLGTGAVVAVEALARWTDQLSGPVSPAMFIPVAEDSGLINELGRIVLTGAIRQGSIWNRDQDANLLLCVNLSHNQLLDPSLIPMVKQLLREHDLLPKQLCLEITESVVMADVAASLTILCQLKDLGVVLAIDDFGTGYSSLSYLRKLPVDILKVDRSFVQSLTNRDDRVIAKVIVDLAHTLGMTTIAEGVETPAQVEILQELNCDMAQGFLLHRPTPSEVVRLDGIDLTTLRRAFSENLDWSGAP